MKGIETLTPVLIAVGVPLVVRGIRYILAKLPGWALPPVAMLLGAGADYLGSLAGLPSVGPAYGALLGSVGVAVRDTYDQVKKAGWKLP